MGNAEVGLVCWKVLSVSLECCLWECWVLVRTHFRSWSSQWWMTCFLSAWPTLSDLWTCHVSVWREMVNHNTGPTSNASDSRVQRVLVDAAVLIFVSAFIFFSWLWLDSHSRDAKETLQKLCQECSFTPLLPLKSTYLAMFDLDNWTEI